MNADKLLFRASSVGKLMKEPKSAKDILSATTKEYLCQLYVKIKYGREKEINNKYFDKGKTQEQTSASLYSMAKNNFYKTNEKNFTNLFVSGTPDIIDGDTVIDLKTSFDIFTFTKAKNTSINMDYWYQLQTYMALTGCKKALLTYCLVNTPFRIVDGELWKESYNHDERNTPSAIELNIIANHVYDKKTLLEYVDRRACFPVDEIGKSIVDNFIEIPLQERIFEFKIERDDKEIERLYERIKQCRKYINDL